MLQNVKSESAVILNNNVKNSSENGNYNSNDTFGFIHDKYLISSEINPMNSRLSTFNKSILNPDTAHKFDSR